MSKETVKNCEISFVTCSVENLSPYFPFETKPKQSSESSFTVFIPSKQENLPSSLMFSGQSSDTFAMKPQHLQLLHLPAELTATSESDDSVESLFKLDNLELLNRKEIPRQSKSSQDSFDCSSESIDKYFGETIDLTTRWQSTASEDSISADMLELEVIRKKSSYTSKKDAPLKGISKKMSKYAKEQLKYVELADSDFSSMESATQFLFSDHESIDSYDQKSISFESPKMSNDALESAANLDRMKEARSILRSLFFEVSGSLEVAHQSMFIPRRISEYCSNSGSPSPPKRISTSSECSVPSPSEKFEHWEKRSFIDQIEGIAVLQTRSVEQRRQIKTAVHMLSKECEKFNGSDFDEIKSTLKIFEKLRKKCSVLSNQSKRNQMVYSIQPSETFGILHASSQMAQLLVLVTENEKYLETLKLVEYILKDQERVLNRKCMNYSNSAFLT